MMNNIKYLKTTLLALMIITVSCERELSDDIQIAGFSPEGEIFTDNFIGLGSDFYLPYNDGFAKLDIFEVDSDVSYVGSASLRIDVPNSTDPDGVYAGAFFRVDGAGRDLTGYDALTFWIKSTGSPTIQRFGFGQSEYATYQTSINDTQLSTTWRKIIIPIPDPAKLVNEKGMFWLVALPDDGDGYSFWLDELKFEKLGSLGQPRPAILGGQDQTAQANVDTSVPLIGLTQTFNLGNGQDVTVETTPAYFDFETSNPFVASVNDLGVVSVDGPGEINPDTGVLENTAVISATLGGVDAAGSLTIEATDINVISIFSDVFANVPVDNYNGFYAEFQTTLGGAIDEGGNNIIDYTELNFVAIEFYGREGSGIQPIDASGMTHLHIDIRVNENIDASDFINFRLFNNFTGGSESVGDYLVAGSELLSNEWVQFDIPLSSFAGLTATDALGALFTVTDGTIANVSLDNIFFYSEN